jgi:hypothetical protein
MKLLLGAAALASTLILAGAPVAAACPGGDHDPSVLACPGGDKDPSACPGGDKDPAAR